MKMTRMKKNAMSLTGLAVSGLIASHAWLGAQGQNPVNYLTQSDALNTSSFMANGARNWTDGQDPHSGADYVITNLVLRTPENALNHKFAGDSLTLGTGAGVSMKSTSDTSVITVDDLRISPGGTRIAHGTANRIMRLHATYTFLPTGGETPFIFRGLGARIFVLTGTFVGTGDFTFEETLAPEVAVRGFARLDLNADLSGFEGSWSVENPVRDPAIIRHFEAHLRADDNIGSPLSTLRPDAVRLINGGGVFAATNATVTISANLNRGITLQNGGTLGATNAASTLIVGAPVTGTGNLYKRGLGTLVLSGDNTHAAGTNIVSSGTLAVESVTGLGANPLRFSAGTTLRVAYPCGALADGFRICGPAPLTIDGTLTLNIKAAGPFPAAFSIPLFFVEAGEAASLPLNKIVVTGGPEKDYTFTMRPVTYLGQSYTAVELCYPAQGTMILVK